MYPRPFLFVAVLTLILTACGPAAPAAPPASTTAISPPATPTESPPTFTTILTATNTPTFTPSPTLPPTSQPVQVQLDPPQAEPGQPVTIHVEGLPPAVIAGKDLACVDLKNEEDRSVAGPIDLSPGESGAFVARLTLPDRLEPGAYHLTVFICGTTLETPPAPESTPPLPLLLVSVPYTVTAPTTHFDQVERIPSPDGRWTALVNAMAGSLDLQGPGGETFAVFPGGSTVDIVNWSPDSRSLLVVRTNWQRSSSGPEVEVYGPIEIWQIRLEDDQVGSPRLVFQSPTQRDESGNLIPEQIVWGTWSPDKRYVLFWQGILSGSVQADGLALWTLDSESGEAIPLADNALLNPRYESWAPDGSALAFTAGGYRSAQVNKWLNLFDTASGQVTTVVSQTEQIPGIVAWSPRGDLIAYAAVPAGETGRDLSDWMSFENPAIAGRRVYLLNPAGGRHWRLNDADAFQDAPTWSEDGETLYYVQREEDTMALMATDPASGQAQAVEGSRRPAPGAVGYYGQSNWDDLLAYRPDAPRAEVPPLVETYTDPTHGYTLHYPAGWHMGQGWQSLYGWHEMPTLSSYPPDGPAPDLGLFSGQALIAIQAIAVSQGDIGALLKKALASPGPDQIQTLVAFDQRELTIAGQPAIRLETMGDFGTINHVLLVLDETQGYILRGRGDGRVFDAVAGSLQFKQGAAATATGRVILGYADHSPVSDLPLWIGKESLGEPVTRTDATGAFTLLNLTAGLVDVTNSHLAFQVPVSSAEAKINLGLLKYPLIHPPVYYYWTAVPLPDLAPLLDNGEAVTLSVCLKEPDWERPSEQIQRETIWSKRPFSDRSEAWLQGWFDQPAVIYDSQDQFTQSFPSEPDLNSLLADWRYLLGLWTGEDIVARSACPYDGPSLEDLLAGRQVEVWLLGYRVTGVQRLDKEAIEYDKSALCDPADRACVERPGYHFAVHVIPAAGYQIIRFAGVEDVMAVHLVENGQELLEFP
jgi:hypothetical protein